MLRCEIGSCGREVPRPLLRLRRRPRRLGHPAPGALRVMRGRRHVVLHPHAQPRLVHDPRLDALEVLVEPAQALLQEADRRAGFAVLREGVRPRADEALARAGQPLDQPRDRVAVAVGPAADRVHGDVDRLVVLAHRALAPVGVAALVGEPRLDEGRRVLDPLQPRVAPAVADDGLVGRQRVAGEHGRRPRQHVDGEHAAADVVHVVGVAVVAGAHRDDRLQRRRAARGDLQAVEAAPGDAEHADRAAAPRLLGQPRDDVDGVLLLLGQVLVLDDPVGVAGAAQVDPHARVPVAGEVGVVVGVAAGEGVALAVGQVLEDGRDGIALGVLGQPDARGQARAVGQRDPRVVDAPDGAGEVGADAHGWRESMAGARGAGGGIDGEPSAGRRRRVPRPQAGRIASDR